MDLQGLAAYGTVACLRRRTTHVIGREMFLHLFLLPLLDNVALQGLHGHLVEVIEVGMLQGILGLHTSFFTVIIQEYVCAVGHRMC